MPLFSKRELYNYADPLLNKFSYRTADEILQESYLAFSSSDSYDIFLSHSYKDAKAILGLKTFIEKLNLSVYIDWVDDAQLDRSRVSKETAKLLQVRMQRCRCLFFVTSEYSSSSKWMPWELGYFDGIKNGRVAILPITEEYQPSDFFYGQEYLGIYPYAVKNTTTAGEPLIFIKTIFNEYVSVYAWLTGKDPYKH